MAHGRWDGLARAARRYTPGHVPRGGLRLGSILPPHGVKNEQKYSELVKAFRAGRYVNPVVVLKFRGRHAQAVSGSHRLAALKTVFGAKSDAAALVPLYILIYDGDHVLREVRQSGNQKLLAEMESLLHRRGVYFPQLVDDLSPYLRTDCGACALFDQGVTAKRRKHRGHGTSSS